MSRTDELLKEVWQIYEDLPKKYQSRVLQGIKYCNECDLRVMANEIPDEILDWWTENDGNTIFCLGCAHFFVQSYKCVVEYGYSEHGEKAEFYSLPIAMKLLKHVRAAREAGAAVPDFDVFDVREYGRMLKAFEK